MRTRRAGYKVFDDLVAFLDGFSGNVSSYKKFSQKVLGFVGLIKGGCKKPHQVLSRSFDIVKSSIIHETKDENLESVFVLVNWTLYFQILLSHTGNNSSLEEAIFFLNTNWVEWCLNTQDLSRVQCLDKVQHYQWSALPNCKIKLHTKYHTKTYIQIALYIHQVHSLICIFFLRALWFCIHLLL